MKRLNVAITVPEYKNYRIEDVINDENRCSIGLLDIFGFEAFDKNYFEQFCINFANEKLQQLYIAYIFKSEIDEFVTEGLKEYLYQLNFKDNQPIIDLYEHYPLGIFHLLDSFSAAPSNDSSLLVSVVKNHTKHPNFKIPKTNNLGFIVIHTARDVEYNITGFRLLFIFFFIYFIIFFFNF